MPPPNLPTGFVPHSQYLLQGNFLQNQNPYTQNLLGSQQRAAERTLGNQQAAIGRRYSGLGQFGSSVGNAAQSQYLSDWSQGLADQQNQTLFGVHEAERDRMMQALQGMGAYETAGLDRAAQQSIAAGANNAQLSAARIAAENSLALQGNQLGFDRMRLGLQGIGMLGDQQLQELQLMAALTGQQSQVDQYMTGIGGQMAGLYGDQFLGAAGMVPGLEGAGYTGYGAALSGQQSLDQALAQARGQRQQGNYDQWQYQRYNPQESLGWYSQLIGALGGMGGQGNSQGLAPAIGTNQPNVNPFMAGLQGALGGLSFGSGFGGGGGGAGGYNSGGASPGWQGFGPGVGYT